MTIQIKPEQERVIGQAIKAGLIEAADQAVEVGWKASGNALKGVTMQVRPQRAI